MSPTTVATLTPTAPPVSPAVASWIANDIYVERILEHGPYGYDPSFILPVIFACLYTLSALVHMAQVGITRQWTIMGVVVAGCISEAGGNLIRIYGHYQPRQIKPYIAQQVVLVITPALFASAHYALLGHVLELFGSEYTLAQIKPKAITPLFVILDVASLCVQGAGSGLAAVAELNASSTWSGGTIVVAGLCIQLMAYFCFNLLLLSFIWKANGCPRTRENPYWTRPFKWFLLALFLSSVLVLCRSIFRTFEMFSGWIGPISTVEWYYFAFDATPVFLSVLMLNIFHPGFVLPRHHSAAVEQGRIRRNEKAADESDFSFELCEKPSQAKWGPRRIHSDAISRSTGSNPRSAALFARENFLQLRNKGNKGNPASTDHHRKSKGYPDNPYIDDGALPAGQNRGPDIHITLVQDADVASTKKKFDWDVLGPSAPARTHAALITPLRGSREVNGALERTLTSSISSRSNQGLLVDNDAAAYNMHSSNGLQASAGLKQKPSMASFVSSTQSIVRDSDVYGGMVEDLEDVVSHPSDLLPDEKKQVSRLDFVHPYAANDNPSMQTLPRYQPRASFDQAEPNAANESDEAESHYEVGVALGPPDSEEEAQAQLRQQSSSRQDIRMGGHTRDRYRYQDQSDGIVPSYAPPEQDRSSPDVFSDQYMSPDSPSDSWTPSLGRSSPVVNGTTDIHSRGRPRRERSDSVAQAARSRRAIHQQPEQSHRGWQRPGRQDSPRGPPRRELVLPQRVASPAPSHQPVFQPNAQHEEAIQGRTTADIGGDGFGGSSESVFGLMSRTISRGAEL